jgi:hypothetical protein
VLLYRSGRYVSLQMIGARDLTPVSRNVKAPPRRVRAQATQTDAEANGSSAEADGSSDSTQQLRDFIVELYADGVLTANDVCHMSTLLVKAGLSAFADLSAAKLGQRNCSRTVQRALGLQDYCASLHHLTLPLVCDDTRRMERRPCPMVHEVLAEEFAKCADVVMHQVQQLQTRNWLDHPMRLAAEAAGDLPIPYGLFVDAAAFKGKGAGTRDSVLAYYVSLIGPTSTPARRRTVFSVRKSHLCGLACSCPCRGRCTTDVVDDYIRWSCDVASSGAAPEVFYDGQPWAKHEVGAPLLLQSGKRVRWVLLEVRADWDQLGAGLGMPRHNQAFPCWLCSVPKAAMHDYAAQPMPSHSHEEYVRLVGRCLVSVTVDRRDAEAIFQALHLDPRSGKSVYGRALSMPVTVRHDGKLVTLRKWDRLELDGACRYVRGSVDDLIGAPPFRLTFWRQQMGVDYSFMSPLMRIRGMRLEHLMIDTLHCLDLGVAAKLIGHSLLLVLQSGVLGNAQSPAGMQQGVRMLSAALRRWYAFRRRVRPRSKQTRLGRITLKMLGEGNLKAKGAETRGLTDFALRVLESKAAVTALGVEGHHLRQSLSHLQASYLMMYKRKCRRRIDAARLGLHLRLCAMHASCANVSLTPKFHLSQHFVDVAKRAGNPVTYSCYPDESHNAFVVRTAQRAYTRDFSKNLFMKEHLLNRDARRVLK